MKKFVTCCMLKGTSFGSFPTKAEFEKVQRAAQFMTENLFIIMCLICNVLLWWNNGSLINAPLPFKLFSKTNCKCANIF